MMSAPLPPRQPIPFLPATITDYNGWLYAREADGPVVRLVGVVEMQPDLDRNPVWEARAFLTGGAMSIEGPDREQVTQRLMAQLRAMHDAGRLVARPRQLVGVPGGVDVLWSGDAPGLPRQRKPALEPTDRSAAMSVPASLEEWARVCTAWGVPARPDELIRVVQAAAWDKATTGHLADARVAAGGRG